MMTAAFFEAVVCVICGLFLSLNTLVFLVEEFLLRVWVRACVFVVLIVNLRKDVFERRTSTRKWSFFIIFWTVVLPIF